MRIKRDSSEVGGNGEIGKGRQDIGNLRKKFLNLQKTLQARLAECPDQDDARTWTIESHLRVIEQSLATLTELKPSNEDLPWNLEELSGTYNQLNDLITVKASKKSKATFPISKSTPAGEQPDGVKGGKIDKSAADTPSAPGRLGEINHPPKVSKAEQPELSDITKEKMLEELVVLKSKVSAKIDTTTDQAAKDKLKNQLDLISVWSQTIDNEKGKMVSSKLVNLIKSFIVSVEELL
jgi:hypothetical protein